jgi:hypothetical protein
MVSKTPLGGGNVQVTFRMPPMEGVTGLYVSGEFNGWSATASPLVRQADGSWVGTLVLEAGRSYRYRYCDELGRWHSDAQADAHAPNSYGSEDSIVVVPDAEAPAAAPVQPAAPGPSAPPTQPAPVPAPVKPKPAGKPAARKPAARKKVAVRPTAKKPAAKKPASKKKPAARKKPAAKKKPSRKPVAKKRAAKKPTARKARRGRG